MNKDHLLAFYRQHFEQKLLPYWSAKLDHEFGGVFTCINNAGDSLVSTDKFSWSQGRFLWVWSRIGQMTDQGLLPGDSTPYRSYSEKTAAFLLNHALLENGTCAFLLTRSGEKKESFPGSGFDTSIFADCFIQIGLTAFSGWTGNLELLEKALQLHRNIDQRLRSGRFKSEPYPVPSGYRSHAIPMIMLHLTDQLACVAAKLNHSESALIAEESKRWMLLIMQDFYQEEGLLAEMLPEDPSMKNSLLSRHITPGHAFESAWFVLHRAVDHTFSEVAEKAFRVIYRAYETGWDHQYGGLLRFTDRSGGRPEGLAGDSPYEKLVSNTWDMKLWWVHSEALYASLLAYERTGDPVFWQIYQRIHEYTFKTFPHPDRSVGEWIQIRERNGSSSDRIAALPVKDPYHIMRNFLLVIEMLEQSH